MLPLSVVVPTRNAEGLLEECLSSIAGSAPAEIIVVDGRSTDATVDIAGRYATRVLCDEGRGLPAARQLGAAAATQPWVALVDADVVVPEGALAALLDEAVAGRYTALQAGLHSVGQGDYWSEALANHHRTGRSRNWFGLVATVCRRDDLLRAGFDERFVSGEDIDLRWRLRRAGARAAVSSRTHVVHRFEPGFQFARGQWDADGRGLARMVRAHGWRAWALMFLPAAAALRGVALSLAHLRPRWIPYYLGFVAYNYRAIATELVVR